ncbi:hypothetical protein DMI69_11675 [Escherichia coli]|nr:hypothetical protein [Escherichia coli]
MNRCRIGGIWRGHSQGRKAFAHRAALVTRDLHAAGTLLQQAATAPFARGVAQTQLGLGLLFSGR